MLTTKPSSACIERIAAFRDNGLRDPLEYEVAIAW